MTYRHINNALNFKDFAVLNKDEPLVKYECPACSYDTFMYYHKVFERCDRFGLPHGRGWVHEPEWVLDLVTYLQPIKDYYFKTPDDPKSL